MAIHNRREVHDENHATVAENRSSADQVGGNGLIIERFDHKFFLALEAIHDHPKFPFAHGND